MNTRTLGLAGIFCSPFLGIDFILGSSIQSYRFAPWSGFFSLIYMTGWLCSIVALYRLKAAGDHAEGRGILIAQLAMLCLGECWNVYAIIQPTATTLLFRTLDLFWPISNCFMVVTGLAVIVAKKLQGWKRFVPFAVGLWFPLSLVLGPMVFGSNMIMLYFSSLYSAGGWLLLALVVYLSAGNAERKGVAGKMPWQKQLRIEAVITGTTHMTQSAGNFFKSS